MDSPIDATLTDLSRFQIAENIHACNIDGEMVLLNPANGLYYGLDVVGARIWGLIKERVTLGQARDALLQDFDVTPEVLWQDLIRLVGDLRAHGLITTDNSP